MSQSKPKDTGITLDTVLDSLQHWRDNKSQYPSTGIPDEIWVKIFALESQGRHKASTLRKFFGLNSTQYSRKHAELCSTSTPESSSTENAVSKAPTTAASPQASPATAFGEAVIETSPVDSIPSLNGTTKTDLSKLKSTKDDGLSFLASSTIVIECIRPDGHRLKIHTTNNSVDVVMKSFFSQEALVA